MNLTLASGLMALTLLVSPLGSEEPARRLTQAQATADARRFFQLLEATHPDPYSARGGKLAFKRQAQLLLADIPAEGLAPGALADRLNLFLAPMRDGHSQVQTDNSKFRDPSPWLPISFGIASDALYLQATELPQLKDCIGYLVLGADGHSLEQFVEAMPFRAENVFGDWLRISNLLRSRKLLSNLIPDIATRETVTFQLQDQSGRRVERTIPWNAVSTARDPARWATPPIRWADAPPSSGEFGSCIFEKAAVGYLRVGSMMGRDAFEYAQRQRIGDLRGMLAGTYRNMGKDLPEDTDQAIRALPSLLETTQSLLTQMRERKVRDLIVDLRGNSGGFTPILFPVLYLLYGDEAYGHVFQSEFVRATSELLLKKQNTTLEGLRASYEAPNLQLGDYLFPAKEKALESADVARKARIAEYKAKGFTWAPLLEELDGRPLWRPRRVIVLCDPMTFSAGFHALAYLRELGAETLGVPSCQSPNAFMENTEFELPESKLKGSFSNSVQSFLPGDSKATIYPLQHTLDFAVVKRYGFDTQASLRWALDLLQTKDQGCVQVQDKKGKTKG